MTMREKIARAILDAMDLMDGLDQMAAERYADATIEAMREPTGVMLEAGREAGGFDAYNTRDNTPDIWQAMIDAARADA